MINKIDVTDYNVICREDDPKRLQELYTSPQLAEALTEGNRRN